MKLPITFVIILLAVLLNAQAQQPALTGGFSQASITNPNVLRAAQFAIKAHDAKISLREIHAAEQQVVAGINYKLKLTTIDGRQAEALVWQKLDDSHELISWKWIPTDHAVLKAEFIYNSGPYPQIHATTIAETPTGLVAAWFGGTHEKHPDVCIWVSRLMNGMWTESAETANGIQTDGTRYPTWNPVLFQPKEGPLMLFYKVGPNPEQWWGELKTSNDGGKSWSAARKLPEGILGPIKNKPVQLPNGDILSPSSNETHENPSKWSVHFERSSDLGLTWQKIGPVHDGVTIQAIQPSILFLGGDKLLALGRSRQDRVFEIRSDDGGKTWGGMALGSLPNNNSGTDAVTLRDGTHLIVYNHIGGTPGKWGGKRTPLNLATSKDAQNWNAALALETDSGEYSYPAIIQTNDGLVHITYTWKRQKVKHVVIDPTLLSVKPIIDGKWPD
ncbi:MAG: exo-alpha-sialidase [Prosthecobacter sp.]|jgi:predicted neuraminidase|nr:exo-alpha-sialidase [Prosthecobacter sp.]